MQKESSDFRREVLIKRKQDRIQQPKGSGSEVGSQGRFVDEQEAGRKDREEGSSIGRGKGVGDALAERVGTEEVGGHGGKGRTRCYGISIRFGEEFHSHVF